MLSVPLVRSSGFLSTPCPKFPLKDRWAWYSQFTEAEKDFRRKNPFPPPPEWYPKKVSNKS